MLLKYFYDKELAHASYMVGCQRAKEAVIVDPGRDVDQYLQMAASEGLKITAVAETHIHADYVSGARELADGIGAKLYVSDEGPAEWKYQFLDAYDHQRLRDGDVFMVGNIKFDVMHTPGHTPESISFVLTDHGGGADKPMGIFTGDFVFVGSIGRPDLLEEAAGIAHTAEPGARDLFRSAERFKALPDYMQVWPAHGAGSACGKGLGAIPSSTVGYEKHFNPSLQFTDENEFVQYILADQPEAPKYFAVMKRVNKEGPVVLGDTQQAPNMLVEQIETAIAEGTIIDLAPPETFGRGHVPKTWNIPTRMLSGWAGWLVDYSRPVYLIAQDDDEAGEATRVLQKIGIDAIAGVFHREALLSKAHESYASGTPRELASKIDSGQATLVDVRSESEWQQGHLPQAIHKFLGRLPSQLADLPHDKNIVVQCQSGARSSIAASLLQAAGYRVMNLAGGYAAWQAAGLRIVMEQGSRCEVGCDV